MNGVRTGAGCGIQNGIHLQVRIGRSRSADVDRLVRLLHMWCITVGVTEHGHSAIPQAPGRSNHAASDLGAVGNQDLGKTHETAQEGLRF